MAKKQPRKQPVVEKTEVYLRGAQYSHRVLETYATVKRRLFDGSEFVEFTLKGKIKNTFAKTSIMRVLPIT